jgi:multiple sugar transport system substrate-binding protein
MKKEKLWLFLIVLVIIVMSGACKAKEGGPIEMRISWWGSEARHNATIQALDVYMGRHPNIKISAEYQGFDGYHEKLITEMASGTQPDISQVDNNVYFADLAANNRLTDMTPYIGKILMLDKYSADGLLWGQYNGVQYGVPTGFNGPVMFYNKAIFDKAGLEYPADDWTWEKFEQISLQLHQKFPDIYGIKEAGAWHIMSQTRQFPNGWFANENGELQDFSDALGKAFAAFNRWRDQGIMPPIDLSAGQDNQQNNLFLSGKAAVQIQHIAQFPMDQAAVAEGAELGIAMFPGSAQHGGVYMLASMPWTIGTSSKYKEQAADLINFLINDEEAAQLLTTQRGVPGSDIARAAIESNLEAPQRKVIDGINALIARTTRIDYEWRAKGSNVIEITLQEESRNAAYHAKTPEQAGLDAYNRIKDSITRANQ